MLIQIYSEDDSNYSFRRISVPNLLDAVNVYWNKKAESDGVGSIEFEWRDKNKADRFFYESETIYINRRSLVVINNKDKFVVNDKSDLFKLYKYLTNEDIDLTIKEFLSLDKENKLGKDF